VAAVEVNPGTFSDLPDALVRELLRRADEVAARVQARVNGLRTEKENLRQQALHRGIIRRKADLDIPPEPSVVGIDGSYQIHRLTALDLCAAAGIAVEGTTKEARRYWPEPYHRIWVEGIPHRGQPANILRGLMVAMELELATLAPHDLVLLDGSFASIIIYVNQGVAQLEQVDPTLGETLNRVWATGDLYRSIITLLRSTRAVAIPKFTSHNELTSQMQIRAPGQPDGRTLATLILEPGEYIHPLPMDHPGAYHLPVPANAQELNQAMRNLRVVYFRPYGWTPALRLEVPGNIANSPIRLAIVLEGITRQFLSSAVSEPYPLFLADRMVKSLSAGVNVVEQSVAQHVAGDALNIETTMLFLQNYRTEGGRGGTS
jgi:hypothetical protein